MLVREIMVPLERYARVHQDRTVAEALEELRVAQRGNTDRGFRFRAILVLDDRGQVVGKLSQWAILRSLEPRLLHDAELASTLALSGLGEAAIERLESDLAGASGSLEQLCRRAARVKAREAMVPAGEAIEADTELPRAIHQLVLQHAQSVLVSERGKIVGLLRLSDAFEVVERMLLGDSVD